MIFDFLFLQPVISAFSVSSIYITYNFIEFTNFFLMAEHLHHLVHLLSIVHNKNYVFCKTGVVELFFSQLCVMRDMRIVQSCNL